ncbi:MAG: CDP-alcohol phosphatidyltransferase family protein [Proteobacteria bacterium]|nr:CDP-alcohol phosphatidyltransferase family protein [Pseudomonadota bacterium]
MFTQLPNLLTLLRIVMVPVVIVLLNQNEYPLALFVFTMAGITDGLDGWIAKKYQLQSALGAMLDPIADKLLLVSTYTMLAVLGDIPFWLLILVLFRDLLIVGGYWILVAMDKKAEIQPIWVSKFNTFFQILLVVLVLVHQSGWMMLDSLISATIAMVVLTAISSGICYVRIGMRRLE